MAKLKYFDASQQKATSLKPAIYTEFLRTGRISRNTDDWVPEEKRYLSHEEVAVRTGKRLEAAGTMTHQRINSFHRSIRFPKLVFHRTLAGKPHLGYCHVTAARSALPNGPDMLWAFYIANFFADIGDDESFFERINLQHSRMYFGIVMEPGEEAGKMTLSRKLRKDGLLFRTHEPKAALKNVLMLGTRDEELQKIIRSL